jgi:hypothetical protein
MAEALDCVDSVLSGRHAEERADSRGHSHRHPGSSGRLCVVQWIPRGTGEHPVADQPPHLHGSSRHTIPADGCQRHRHLARRVRAFRDDVRDAGRQRLRPAAQVPRPGVRRRGARAGVQHLPVVPAGVGTVYTTRSDRRVFRKAPPVGFARRYR